MYWMLLKDRIPTQIENLYWNTCLLQILNFLYHALTCLVVDLLPNYFIRKALGMTLSSCLMKLGSISSISYGVHEKTSIFVVRNSMSSIISHSSCLKQQGRNGLNLAHWAHSESSLLQLWLKVLSTSFKTSFSSSNSCTSFMAALVKTVVR